MKKIVNDVLILLCKGISNRRLYFFNHPKVIFYAKTFLKELATFYKMSKKEEFFVGIVDGHFIFNGKRLFGPTIVGRQLIHFLGMLRCGGVSFKEGLTLKEVRAFMDLADGMMTPLNSLHEARELFKQKGIESIAISGHYTDQPGTAASDNKRPWEGREIGGFLQSPILIYQDLFDVVTRAHGEASFGRELDIDSARSVSEFMLRFTQSNFADVMQYIHYPDYDSYTIGHSVRVSSIAIFLGMKMNWPKENILALGTAAILHDIGKSKISSEILYKESSLTYDEYRLIQEHPRVGAELLLAEKDASPIDVAAAWGHHLRYDGQGYPQKPAWAVRSPAVALLQICDVFEALTAVRPYKQAMDPQHAFSVMTTDAGAFHPGLLSTFIAFIGIYPPGTYIELSDGRVGMVTSSGKNIDRPQLRITQLKDGTRLEKEDQYDIALGVVDPKSLKVSHLLLNYLDTEP
jgi:HD-GYP domain-containing protein (c-di-GMP phosphodiesterase class II)